MRHYITLAAIATILLIFLFPTGELISNQQTDIVGQYYYWREFMAHALTSWRMPWLNDQAFGGLPFMAGMQSAIFYPTTLLYLVFPTATAINLEIFFNLTVTCLTMTYLVKTYGFDFRTSAACGLTWLFSGFVFQHVYAGHLSNLATMAWAPLVLALLRTRSRWAPVAIALHILGGHAQYVYYTAIVFFLVVGWRMIAPYAIAAGLCAIQLLPTFEAYRESARSSDYARAWDFYFPFENLSTFFYDPGPDMYLGLFNAWETSIHLGFAGLFALWGMLKKPKLAAVVVVGFALAFGIQTPIFEVLYHHLPLFGSFRGVSKFIWPTGILVMVCVAHGLPKKIWVGTFVAAYSFFWVVGAGLNDTATMPEVEAHPIGDARVMMLDKKLKANAAMAAGYYGYWGDDPFVTKRYSEFFHACGTEPVVQIARVRYAYTSEGLGHLDFSPPRKFNRFNLIGKYELAGTADYVCKKMTTWTDTVTLEETIDGELGAAGKIQRIGPDRVKVTSPTPTLLFITDAYSKAWGATVNGVSARILPADHAFMAIPLPAGTHVIRLDYIPKTFWLGVLLSCLSIGSFLWRF